VVLSLILEPIWASEKTDHWPTKALETIAAGWR